MQAAIQYRTRNLCFLIFLLDHYTSRLIGQTSSKLYNMICLNINDDLPSQQIKANCKQTSVNMNN